MTKYKYWNVSYGIGQHNCALNYFHFPYFELIHTHTHPSMYFQTPINVFSTHTHPSMYFQTPINVFSAHTHV
jgi:hypothetical protein